MEYKEKNILITSRPIMGEVEKFDDWHKSTRIHNPDYIPEIDQWCFDNLKDRFCFIERIAEIKYTVPDLIFDNKATHKSKYITADKYVNYYSSLTQTAFYFYDVDDKVMFILACGDKL